MNINKPLVSVVVPCYNMEQHLPKFMASLTAQTYQNLDIILVDDGSTDRTAEMLDGYAREDGRIRVIHQQNGGISRARAAGFQVVRGGVFNQCRPR